MTINMKLSYILLTLLFVVPSVPKNRPVSKKVELVKYQDKKLYIESLDSAINKELEKHSKLRQEVVYKIDYLVHQQHGGLEEDIHRLAGN